MSRAALALVASLLACAEPLGASGEDCLFNGDCASPLVCAGRRCRAPCRDDRDCVNGWRCRPAGQGSLRVCLPPAEHGYCVGVRDCDAPAVCGVTGVCGSQCLDAYDCALNGGVSRCAPTRQDPTVLLCTDNPLYQP
ncbi:MAG: hypothetical protein U0324_39850 [Polyangiales bacterium]